MLKWYLKKSLGSCSIAVLALSSLNIKCTQLIGYSCSSKSSGIPWSYHQKRLTSSHRMPYKLAILCWNGVRRASKHVFRFVCVLARSLVNTSPVACHWVGWRVYKQVFLGVHGATVRQHRTKGTAINERVHSFVDFCLIPLSKTCSFDVPAKNL